MQTLTRHFASLPTMHILGRCKSWVLQEIVNYNSERKPLVHKVVRIYLVLVGNGRNISVRAHEFPSEITLAVW